MRDRLLKKLAECHSSHPGRMLIIVILLTVILGMLSTRLSVTMRWSDLLPVNDRRTLQYNKIIDEFVSATSIIVVVQGEEDRIKAFADALAPRLLKAELQKEGESLSLIQRVDYKTEIDFLQHHGLMLIKEDDLENMQDIFTDPNLSGLLFNINDAMEKEYVGREESLSTRQKEDQAVMFLDGIESLISVMTRMATGEDVSEDDVHQAADMLILGEPYFLSYDKKALILNAIPNFTVMDIDLCVEGTEVIQSMLDDMLMDYPGVQVGLTGFIPICHDEMVYSQKSLGYTSTIAIVAILILLIISFRMWVAPLFAIMNLLLGIVWAIGIVTLLVGQLNIMTQMMAVILLGLGIDFAIHLISAFTEYRAAGQPIQSSLELTFLKTGRGVVTGALTTACAFLTLLISHSRGMKEMGLVTGSGLLAILMATFLILPVFLVYRERWRERKIDRKSQPVPQRDLSFRFLGSTGSWLSKHWGLALSTALVMTLLLIWAGSQITFDQNYMNIEPEGITSVVLQDTVIDKFDLGMDYAMILSDTPEESRRLANQSRDLGSVAMVEDISLYLPSAEEQQKRRPHIRYIRQAMQSSRVRQGIAAGDFRIINEEIDRLRMNVMEMQDMAFLGGQDKVDEKCRELVGSPGDTAYPDKIQALLDLLNDKTTPISHRLSSLQRHFSPYFKTSVLAMASTDPIRLNDLPPSILDRYSNTARSQFLVTVFPAGNIWKDADFLRRFVNTIETVSDKATGMPPVFMALIDIIGRDGQSAMLLTLIIVFLLLWADFRNPRHALFGMIPLTVGMIWMVGLMKLTGQQFTVMNVMGLPMILGIGIDDGVHIVHRWVSEGKGHIRTVFSSTGKAILLTSLTTMLGFGSLVFSVWRGFGHLGAALFVGVGACFLTTILILSGILGWTERRRS